MTIRPRNPIRKTSESGSQEEKGEESPTGNDYRKSDSRKRPDSEVNKASKSGIVEAIEFNKDFILKTIIFIIFMCFIIVIINSISNNSGFLSNTSEMNLNKCIHDLEQKYKNQEEALLANAVKMLKDEKSPIHSLILLYRDEGGIAEEFARDLMKLLNTVKKINGVLQFKKMTNIGYENESVHYVDKVLKHKNLIILKLQDLSFESSRMFQVLCDENLSQKGPFYFISTLKDTSDINHNSSANDNPVSKASRILRRTWRSLPENELSPILSRIIRNVVEILPANIKS